MAEAKRILVVDDEMEICSLLEEILSEEGFSVETAYNPIEALEHLSRRPLHLLICDLHMPQMDGVELFRRAREIVPGLSCVLMTGKPTADSAIRALRLGVREYLTKPIETRRLLSTVKRLLEGIEACGNGTTSASAERKGERRCSGCAGSAGEEVSKERRNRPESRQKVDGMALLNEISRVVTTVLDLDTLLNLSLKLICSKFGAGSSSVMLYVPQTAELIVRASQGLRKNIVGRAENVGQGVAGWVAQKKRPLLVKDIGSDGRFHPRLHSPYRSSSFISVPLVSKGDFLGVLNVSDKTNGEPFTEAELRLVEVIAAEISLGMENVKLQQAVRGEILKTVQALSASLEAKDSYTSGHSLRVLDYATRIASRFDLHPEQMNLLRSGAQLHDIGKIGIAEDILLKARPLSSREMEIIREHPIIGERIVDALRFPEEVKQVVRGHHESFNGRGYPDGLAGDSIPFFARIMRVADAFDAMTSARPYRPPLSYDRAWQFIRERSGAEFDPVVVGVFGEVLQRDLLRPAGRLS